AARAAALLAPLDAATVDALVQDAVLEGLGLGPSSPR
ncbi:MAG: hypothetical protein QOF76_2603, partial [Solirubrobacteraceae bacterium]|nr:hypothetical protein [Solirubrobacteraceae bacterium]